MPSYRNRSREAFVPHKAGPRSPIRGSRPLTEPERQGLANNGFHPHATEGLLTLECGHHVIRILPQYSGATSALCGTCARLDP